MADVQLEQGHVRIANALLEALLYAKFSATQLKIVYCVMRLSWGWRARTVRITQGEIALRCNTSAAGGFRKEFHELVRAGVIIEVESAHGRTAAVYAINKNFETWGRFSVPPGTLNALFRERPEHADKLRSTPSQGQATDPIEGNSPPSEGQATEISLPSPVLLPALLRAPKSTGKGTLISVSASDDNELDPPKDTRKTEKDSNCESHAREGGAAEASAEYGDKIVETALAAIAVKWAGHPVEPSFGRYRQILAATLVAAGVELELARTVIAHKVRASVLPEPPKAIGWFAIAITEAHRDAEHERRKHDGDTGRRRGGAPMPIGEIAEPPLDRDTLDRLYHLERNAAGIAWAKDPANADDYRLVCAASNHEFRELLGSSWGVTGRDRDIISRCADHAGFPAFEQWLEARSEPIRAEQGAGADDDN